MSAYKNGVMTIYLAKWKLLRTSDARGKSRSPVFMYLGPCAIQNFMATHTEVVEIFQSGFKVVLVVQHCNSYSHVTIMAVWLELGVVITLTSQNCRWLDALANACHSGSLPLWATSLHYFTTLWRRGVGKVRRGKWVSECVLNPCCCCSEHDCLVSWVEVRIGNDPGWTMIGSCCV